MSRLLIVSNRLPVTVGMDGETPSFSPSVGGLATGIASLETDKKRIWYGWPGIATNRLADKTMRAITDGLKDHGCRPVFLTARDVQDFYFGFSNKTLWPLFHYFTHYASFDENFWKSYRLVNTKFCDAIVADAKPDDTIWVHDYQLMLLPKMLRENLPDATIGFFNHIPFPSFELIRLLPWRTDILEGLLGADLVGFHEYDYVRHFLSSVYRILGYEPHLNQFRVGDRLVQADAIPMGIDYERFAASGNQNGVRREIKKIQNHQHVRVILSVDRLDYTKGILLRLEAFDWFLRHHPEYRGEVTLVVVAVPSRTQVDAYNQLREDIEKIVGRINGEYGTIDWTPVSYMYRSLPFDQLAALYHVADIALITPLRDGMNLVAKEFVACQRDKKEQGVLILSEMAGAAAEMSEAVVINPHDKNSIVASLKQALEMPQAERRRRNDVMQGRLSRYTVGRWAGDFIHRLDDVKHKQRQLVTQHMTPSIRRKIESHFKKASRRLILLDYDGTLAPFVKNPNDACPDHELLSILKTLVTSPENEVVIISGRDRTILTQWLGDLNVNMVAEHGAFIRHQGKPWTSTLPEDDEWKDIVRPALELYVDRTPGSFIEEKTYSLVWHCRKSDPDLAKLRMQELKDAVVAMSKNLNLGVFEGNKIIEVKPTGINKGLGVQNWLTQEKWPFILAAGDDYTDEDMFHAVGEAGYTCKIGPGPSRARYRLNAVTEFRAFLKGLYTP
jgi:trehalose 6-phosphate synthase/phosphatase